MFTYLKHILFFTIGLLIINLLAYFFISKPLLYEKYLIPTDTLKNYQEFLFADSHGEAVNQSYLAEYGIYNFSYASDSYCDMYNKLTFLYNNDIPLDTIYISVDDHTLSPYRSIISNLNRSIYYSDLNSYKQYSHNNFVSYYFSKFILPYLPLFNTSNSRLFSDYILKIILPKNKPTSNRYTISSEVSKKNKESGFNQEETKERMQYQFPEGKSSAMLEACLDDIVQLCNRNNTTLIGIMFPLSSDYLQVLNDRSYHADSLLNKQGIKIINMKYAFVDNNTYFKDPDHVSKEGAKALTILLAKQLSSPLYE